MAEDAGLAVRVEVVERDTTAEVDALRRAHARELAARDRELAQARSDAAMQRLRVSELTHQLHAAQARSDELRQEVIEARAKTRDYFLDAQRLARRVEALQSPQHQPTPVRAPQTASEAPQRLPGGNPAVFGF